MNGFASLVQRFAANTVRAVDGTSFDVEAKGVVETQFTSVNPDGAAVVFTATLDPQKTAAGAVPVAVAHPFGSGRFVYVGFSFENITEAGRTKAFSLLLDAATGARPAVAASAPRVTPTVLRGEETNQRSVQAPPPMWPPPPPVPASTGETAPDATEPNPKLLKTGLTYFRTAKVKIYTGNDNKEAPSNVTVELYINGSATDDNYGLNPD